MNRKIVIAGLIGLVICLVVIGIVGRTKKDKSEVVSLYNTAMSWQSKGKMDKAAKSYQELVKQFPHEEQAADAWYSLGKIYEKEGLMQKAKEAYSKIIAAFSNFKHISDVEKRLWDTNIKILFSPIVTDGDIIYNVEPGDTLTKIATEHNTTVGLIMRSNKLESDLIRPGQRLKIFTAKYNIIIDKSQNSLTLKADDVILKVYSVATGKHNSTPSGTFKIVEKLNNPDWYKRGEGIIPAGSPKNVLGTRWLGLSEPQYGIHGGASKGDLSTQVTDGCIRMTDSEVEELFAILPRGTEVTIVD